MGSSAFILLVQVLHMLGLLIGKGSESALHSKIADNISFPFLLHCYLRGGVAGQTSLLSKLQSTFTIESVLGWKNKVLQLI